jgi:hypothetical protein
MKQHKWHKEIKAWADGEKVYGRMDTHKSIIAEFEVTKLNHFDIDNHYFYVKPQPKEPQYINVYGYLENQNVIFRQQLGMPYIGKIKLEVEDAM